MKKMVLFQNEDYLLYHLNLRDPTIYNEFSEPTNQIVEFLEKYARRCGRLLKGGLPDTKAAARLLIQRWRSGRLGSFVLDDITADAVDIRANKLEELGGSLSQARKAAKEARKEKWKQRQVQPG